MKSRISSTDVRRRDQLGLDLRVDAVEAGVVDRRRADPDVDLAAPARRSSATICFVVVPRTIESSTTIRRLPRTTSRSGLSFSVTPRWRIVWRRLDERPAGVAVADQPLAVRDAGLARRSRPRPARRCPAPASRGRRRPGARGQLLAHPAPRLVQVAALHVRVGPGEVDQLEDAQRRCGLGEADRARRAGPPRGRRSRRARRRARTRRRGCRGRSSRERGPSRRASSSIAPQAGLGRRPSAASAGSRPRTSGRKPYGSRTPMTRRSSRTTRL